MVEMNLGAQEAAETYKQFGGLFCCWLHNFLRKYSEPLPEGNLLLELEKMLLANIIFTFWNKFYSSIC